MPRRFASSIDLTAFALIGAMMHPVASDPAGLGTGDKGRLWYNTTNNRLKVWNGTSADDLLDLGAATGTLTASKISDLATVVQGYRLDQFAAPNTDVSMGGNKLTNLADGVASTDAITLQQLNAAVAGISGGLTLKGSVRVASTTNVSVSSPPASIDGVALTNGDVVLLAGQTAGAENGPYVWTAAGAAMQRASNFDTSAEATLGSFWIVRQGSQADQIAILSNDTAITLGTTALTFVFRGAAGASYTAGGGIGLSGTDFSVAAGTGLTQDPDGLSINTAVVARKLSGAIPAATSGAFTVSGSNVVWNHGLNNTNPDIKLLVGSAPVSGYTTGDTVEPDYVPTDANNVTITLPAPPAANNWSVSALG